jgi:hypothetical protein
MAKNSRKAVKQQDTEPVDPVDFPTPESAIMQAWDAYWRTILASQKALNAFARHRVQMDIALEGAIIHARNVLDLIKAQQLWATSAAKEYLSEWMKLTLPPDVGLLNRPTK